MAKKPSSKDPPEGVDDRKRSLFRLLMSPVVAATRGYELPANHKSQNPPTAKRVLRANANAEVLGFLGPFAKGQEVAGYRFFGAQIGEDRIDYVFERAGTKLRVRLLPLDTNEGLTQGQSASFRVISDGEAPETDRIVVAAHVAREVIARDRGQLWVMASEVKSDPPKPKPTPTR